MNQVIIAIPLYKTKPCAEEQRAFIQMITILKKHPFSFFCPREFDFHVYKELLESCFIQYTIEPFAPHYFSSIRGYNRLLLKPSFYKRYSNYKYILICQLDVWIFKDELAYWCSQNYDYIGAPFLLENDMYFRYKKTPADYPNAKFKVGNGGLSLRNVSTMIKVLTKARYSFHKIYTWKMLQNAAKTKKRHAFSFLYYLYYFYPLNFMCCHSFFPINEDAVISIYIHRHTKFSMPPPQVAAKFSLDSYPSYWLKQQKQLPFGGHAYLKYDKECFLRYRNKTEKS